MKRLSIFILGLSVSGLGLSQGSQTKAEIPFAPKAATSPAPSVPAPAVSAPDNCPPASPKKKPDCPTPKKKVKPKVKPVPKPTPKPCPEAKTKIEKVYIKTPCEEKKCEPKVEERVVEREKKVYLDRTVTIDNAPKNTANLVVLTNQTILLQYQYRFTTSFNAGILAGIGPHGLVTDSYNTKDRKDEYAFRKEQDEAKGALIGVSGGFSW